MLGKEKQGESVFDWPRLDSGLVERATERVRRIKLRDMVNSLLLSVLRVSSWDARSLVTKARALTKREEGNPRAVAGSVSLLLLSR